jgi:hypothetical protein
MKVIRIKSYAYKKREILYNDLEVGDFVIFTKLNKYKLNVVINKPYKIIMKINNDTYAKRKRCFILNDKLKTESVYQTKSNEFYFYKELKT